MDQSQQLQQQPLKPEKSATDEMAQSAMADAVFPGAGGLLDLLEMISDNQNQQQPAQQPGMVPGVTPGVLIPSSNGPGI
ncbi:hypothetical protein A4U49_01490 [Acidithiobacillus ferrivorans]|uniref:hypothetical protein n=1 Tax=Acidithiobacillus ferrivorans TaxID=160808 RepID=UPI00089375F6|nr:hypothetical protein [Acidithiobacillus ferrivorans]OFA17559.1 hypothetical protein A4U49_01490 [Acidithiobacillus ferrivorans]